MCIKNVPIKKLQKLFKFLANDESDYDVWGTNITWSDILLAVQENRLNAIPYFEAQKQEIPNYNHAERIAYLVINKDDTPIELDVGVPSLGYYSVKVTDGHHRIMAAAVRGERTIKAEISGELEYYTHLFVRKVKRYEEM